MGSLNSDDRFKREINTFVKRFNLALDDDITIPKSDEDIFDTDNIQDNNKQADNTEPKTPVTTFASQPTQRETYHKNGAPTLHQKTPPDNIGNSEARADSQVSEPSHHSSNPTFTQERRESIIQHQADKLRRVLAGEMIPKSVINSSVEEENDTTTGANFPSDEIYRKAATLYEEKNARKVTFVGSPTQKGWDLTSEDEKEKRYIEVKGKGKSWQDNEIVAISRAQMLKAAELINQKNRTGTKKESWWLYVVECVGNKHYQVLPIHNPVDQAKYWSLSGAGWRDLADNPQEINLS